jgi:signal transduction histidine kinase
VETKDRRVSQTKRLALVLGSIVAMGVLVTLVALVEERFRLESFSPEMRPTIEVAGASIVLFAALILAIPSEQEVRPARNAFVAALVVLGVANAFFGLLPALGRGVSQELPFYPYVAARYVIILLFVLAGLERPRATLGRYVVFALLALVGAEVLVVVLGSELAVPVELAPSPGSTVVVVRPLLHVGLLVPSIVLFAVGSGLAARLHLRTGSSEYLWLSSALAVQVVAQVHEILFPAFLGPILRWPDVLRFVSFALLGGGAFAQMARLHRDRTHTLRQQNRDLQTQQAVTEHLRSFAEQEADFRAVVTHELATPIATIRTFGHVARLRASRHDNPQLQEVLDGIVHEAERLQQLARRMEELRDLEVAEFSCDLRAVMVHRSLQEAVQFARGLPGGHDVSLSAEESRVMADPVRLGQALRNVLGNATRYSPPGTRIVVEGAVDPVGTYRITVDDEGPGIPDAERRKVLRRYARGSSGASRPGQGLGLYVASSILEAHGAELRLGSSPLGGTRVQFLLQLTPHPHPD